MWPCSQWSTSLDRLSVGPFTHDTMGRPGGFVNVLWILGQQMDLMAPYVVRFYKCLAAGDVVDVSVDMEPIDKLVGGLGYLYCRVFLQFTVVSFVLGLSVGFGHVVRRVLNHHSPSLVYIYNTITEKKRLTNGLARFVLRTCGR